MVQVEEEHLEEVICERCCPDEHHDTCRCPQLILTHLLIVIQLQDMHVVDLMSSECRYANSCRKDHIYQVEAQPHYGVLMHQLDPLGSIMVQRYETQKDDPKEYTNSSA